MVFQASDPFPLIAPGSSSETEIRAHSARVDAWLGLRTSDVERDLALRGPRSLVSSRSGEKQELWLGLDVQSLLTPYTEIRWILAQQSLHAGQTVVDLGAAYGRMGFVLHRHFPGVRFIGYEFVGGRVKEGQRCLQRAGCEAAELIHADLTSNDFEPALADWYFLYDFGSPKAIEKVLYDLRRLAERRGFVLIVRGRHARKLIEARHSWLLQGGAKELASRLMRIDFSILQTG